MTLQTVMRFLTVMLVAAAIATESAIADDAETKEVKVKDITIKVPTSWKEEEPKSRLRLTQFRIPAVKGEKSDAELAIFSFGGSDVGANIRRWIFQFQPEGRKTKISSGDAELGKYILVELSGTYNKPVGPPIQGKTIPVSDSRVLAVILAVKDSGVYYFKMVGLDKTVAAQGEAMRVAFGADASKEKEIKQDEKKSDTQKPGEKE